ncbi:MAG: HEAT repeat domain-containing protein [Chlamydiales bacterium]
MTSLFLALIPLFGSIQDEVRMVQSHLLVGDEKSALQEARVTLRNYPDSPLSYQSLLQALAANKRDGEMIKFWYTFEKKFREEAHAQDTLEQMCWGVLRKGRASGQISTRLISLIGAALTQDMYALEFLLEGMRSTNVHIRSVAVKLASFFKDHVLIEEIARLLAEEKSAVVRVAVIEAIQELKATKFYTDLVHIVGSSQSSALEINAAIKAIISITESIEYDELIKLVQSKRAPLRHLACECIAKFFLKEHAELLAILMHDSHPEVAASALRAIGLLHITQLRGKETAYYLRRLCSSSDPSVGVTAAWALLLQKQEEGKEALRYWLFHENSRYAAFAAASVAASGERGIDLALEALEVVQDPYVRMNLALALVGQRKESEKACEVLNETLQSQKEKWMIEEGIFSPIQKSQLSHRPEIPNYPEVVNQTVRLEILNVLAILEYPRSEEAIKQFLKERRWGVTGLAAETLLGEGDETAIEHVRALLSDPDQEVRLEAALALATWGRDHSALPTLIEEYRDADRQLQIKILEALGRIGSKEAIPFLIERLQESSLNLRIIAAAILLQTIKA